MIRSFACGTLMVGAILACVGGCEQKTPAPPATGSSNQPLGGLASNPTSLPGRSAQAGKNAAAGIQNQQDAAANAANQITGQSAGEVVVGGLKFAVPEGWTATKPASNFVTATYMIPSAGNAQCNFSTAGGDVASNINRWRTQITDADGKQVEGEVSEHTVAGMSVTIFKATGTYATMSGGKQANTAFRGAIVKMPSQSVFVRLTGPADQVAGVDAAWQQMVLGFTK